MRFWDSSALVPLVVDEPASRGVREIFAAELQVLVAWTTEIECASALARLERAGDLGADDAHRAFGLLRSHAERWHRVEPSDGVTTRAIRLLRVHDLRTGDSLQLASAIEAAESRPADLGFVTLDERLARAARREGFPVEPDDPP